jgi:hypothetical protein
MSMQLEVAIGDKNFHTFLFGDIIVAFILNNDKKVEQINQFVNRLFVSNSIQEIKNFDYNAFKTVLHIIDELPANSIDVIHLIRVLEEGSIVNPLNIKDPSNIPKLVKSVTNQKSYPEYLLIPLISLLSGQKTMIDLIQNGFLEDLPTIFEIIDFVKTRK